MEMEDNDTTSLKKKILENGDSSTNDPEAGSDDNEGNLSVRKSVCNGGLKENDEKDGVVENGDHSKDSGLDSNSNSNSVTANVKDESSDEDKNGEGDEDGMEGDEKGEDENGVEGDENGEEGDDNGEEEDKNEVEGDENGVEDKNEVDGDENGIEREDKSGVEGDENGREEDLNEVEDEENSVKEKVNGDENGMEGDKSRDEEDENRVEGAENKADDSEPDATSGDVDNKDNEEVMGEVGRSEKEEEPMEGIESDDKEKKANREDSVEKEKCEVLDDKSKKENPDSETGEKISGQVNEDKLEERRNGREKSSEAPSNKSKQSKEKSGPKEPSLKDSKDSGNDDVEIIGESTVVKIDSPSIQKSSNVILMTSGLNRNFSSNSSLMGAGNSFSSAMTSMSHSFIMNGRGLGSPMSLLPQQTPHAPPKPKSSLDQIELIRWEIQNRLNTRPKYFKPNPSAELGPLAKFLFDIGSNLIKEAVYHELVKIQSKKNDDNALSEKEKEDLGKLKDIERDLHGTIGHLKLKMRKKCKICHFQTESGNVIYHHRQFPHEDGKNLHCAYCTYVTKQPMNFKFHLESEHGVQPRLHDRKAFYECDLCPYENNQEQKLNAHKQRCIKQFRPLFNLHPSCLSGAEINLCLENIFYKPVIPKNLKILQQKHAQQQAALAEARRQQAEVQALAAQKNAAAVAAKRQLRQIAPAPVSTPQRFSAPVTRQLPQRSQPQTPSMPAVRYNSRPQVAAPAPAPAPVRNTVASMLRDRKEPTRPLPRVVNPAPQNNAPGGFEVCEICGGYVKDRKALRIHFFYAHRIDLPFNLFDRNQPPLYCATCYVRFWTAQGLRKHIDVHVQEKKVPENFMSEGVHGKCISCGQLVGNIVVHMRVVHNREIHHYINALMCMFCGASFNNRPNVERHIAEVHGTIDIATGAVKVKPKLKSNVPPPKPPQNQKKSNSGKDSLVKGSVCVLCNLNFGRNVDLTRHCMRMHHTCMKCGMVVIDKASLLKHTCLSSPSGTRDCTMCSETGFHPAYYVKHLRDKHLKKFVILVARVSAPIIEKWIKRPYPFDAGENDPVEISDSEEEEAPEPKVKSPNPEKENNPESETTPKKKVRIGPASKIGRQRVDAQGGSGEITSSGTKRKMSETPPERMSKRRR